MLLLLCKPMLSVYLAGSCYPPPHQTTSRGSGSINSLTAGVREQHHGDLPVRMTRHLPRDRITLFFYSHLTRQPLPVSWNTTASRLSVMFKRMLWPVVSKLLHDPLLTQLSSQYWGGKKCFKCKSNTASPLRTLRDMCTCKVIKIYINP